MSIIHFWFSANLLWYALLFALGGYSDLVGIDSKVLSLSVVAGVLALLTSRHVKTGSTAVVFLSVVATLSLNGAYGRPMLGEAFPRIVTECVLVAVSALLCRRTGSYISELEDTISQLIDLRPPISFQELQSEFYQELRRARRFGRPVSLLAVRPVGINDASPEHVISGVIQKKLAQDFQDVQFAALLHSGVGDGDLIAKADDGFLILLPEADRDTASKTAADLAYHVKQASDCDLMIGISDFPKSEVTLAGLVKAAEAQLQMFMPSTSSYPRNDAAHYGTAHRDHMGRELVER